MKKPFAVCCFTLLLFALSAAVCAAPSGEGDSALSAAPPLLRFEESLFEGMTVTITETGAPLVDDTAAKRPPAAPGEKRITAVPAADIWMFRDARRNVQVLMIPEGRFVTVLRTDPERGSALVVYAGYKGWVRSANLRLK